MRHGALLAAVVGVVCLLAVPGTAAAADANTIDTGADASGLGVGETTGDVDGDGDPEIVFVDGSDLKWYDPIDETVTATPVDANAFAVGDLTGNGQADVAYVDTNGVLRYWDSAANTTTSAQELVNGEAIAVGNDPNIWYRDDVSGELERYDVSTDTTTTTGEAVAAGTQLAAGSVSGGSVSRIAFINTNGHTAVYDTGLGSTTATTTDGAAPVFGDTDGDIDQEIAFLRGGEVYVWDFATNGGVSTTGKTAAAIATGDVAGHTREDVAVVSGGAYQVYDVQTAETADTGISAAAQTVGAADVTGDGEAEVIGVDGTLTYYDASASAPQISDVVPDGDTTIERTQRLAAQINDSDLGSDADESVAVEFVVDGTVVHSETLSSDTVVDTTYTPQLAGDKQFEVRATDRATGTTVTRTLTVPANLTIRNESAPAQVVSSSGAAEVRFFGEDEVFSRPVDDGTVSFANLPVDEQFEAVIDVDGYKTRRVIIPSLIEQQEAYIAPDNGNTVEVVFEIDSPTGQFPPEETILFVERPITRNNSTTYQTISGGTFGATGQQPVEMVPGSRYRLRVESADGSNARALGSFVPVTSRIETLQIQRIEPRSNADAGQIVYGGLTSYNNASAIAVRHRDLGDSVDSVQYRIEYSNGTVAVPNTTETADTFAAVYPLNLTNTTNVTVFYEAQLADGATVTGSFSTGVIDGPVGRFGADPQVLSIVSWVAILATMGLLVIINTDIAPVGGVAVATGLTILGTVAIPLPILGLSGVLAALNAFGGGVGR